MLAKCSDAGIDRSFEAISTDVKTPGTADNIRRLVTNLINFISTSIFHCYNIALNYFMP
jgi:hypothetical protein